jgi:multidrug resistance efflux pump
LQQLRLCCDQATRRLADLKQYDRWFGSRLAAATKEKLAKVLGPEHTWAKVLAILIVAALIVLFFVPVTYRVEGNFIVRSEDVSYLTAPFDGYISESFVRAGDVVEKDAKLVALDTSELLLDESAALSDMNRYLREAEKARASGALADMRISLALADQSKARLELIRYRLGRAVIRVPFAGVVVEGDLRDRLKAPVKQGDALLKIAKIDTLFVEAEIDERDIHEILGRSNGEIAFVTQPKLKYPVKVTRIEPAAMPKKDGNFFKVRCEFVGNPQTWWRPGMSGVCKLNVEKRSLFWIISHRTVDFLRLKLWW